MLDHNARIVDWWRSTWPWLAPTLLGFGGAVTGFVLTHGSVGERFAGALLGAVAGAAAALRFFVGSHFDR